LLLNQKKTITNGLQAKSRFSKNNTIHFLN
jgi:hypothetical protein